MQSNFPSGRRRQGGPRFINAHKKDEMWSVFRHQISPPSPPVSVSLSLSHHHLTTSSPTQHRNRLRHKQHHQRPYRRIVESMHTRKMRCGTFCPTDLLLRLALLPPEFERIRFLRVRSVRAFSSMYFNHFTFSCLQLRHSNWKNITRISNSCGKKKITRKSTLKFELE